MTEYYASKMRAGNYAVLPKTIKQPQKEVSAAVFFRCARRAQNRVPAGFVRMKTS
jgi:hypothetical protein